MRSTVPAGVIGNRMQPNPSRETRKPVLPNIVYFIVIGLPVIILSKCKRHHITLPVSTSL